MTDVFPRDSASPAWRLDEDQVRDFRRDGFITAVPVLDRDQVGALRDRLERIRADLTTLESDLYEVESAWSADPDAVVFHFLGAWMVDELFHDLLWHPAITVPSAQLLDVDELRLWHDQVFYKPRRHAGVVPWHQDFSYWGRTGPARHITVHLALDDADVDNGCIHYVPGSHRWPVLPQVPFDAPMDWVRRHLDAGHRDGFSAVAAPLRAGEASIHHSHTIHGSFANGSDRPRRSTVVNTMAADTRVVDGSEPLLKGVPLLPEGALVEGEHFPLLL